MKIEICYYSSTEEICQCIYCYESRMLQDLFTQWNRVRQDVNAFKNAFELGDSYFFTLDVDSIPTSINELNELVRRKLPLTNISLNSFLDILLSYVRGSSL